MTPTEILQSSTLEILFERRNKDYGAYTLRKFYNNRLLMALSISLSTVLLIMFLVSDWQNSNVITFGPSDKSTVVIQSVDFPPEPKVPEPLRQKASNTPQPPTVQHTTIDIVPDQLVPKVDNTTLNLDNANIGFITSQGNGGAIDVATIPPSAGSGDMPAAKPVEAAPAAPSISKAPEFPGGQAAWLNFLNRYLQVPEDLEAGEKRAVSVRFWVSEDGSVTNFQVIKSGGTSFDNEVIRVLKKMPRWKPAIQNGQPIATGFTQPETFTAIEE